MNKLKVKQNYYPLLLVGICGVLKSLKTVIISLEIQITILLPITISLVFMRG